MSEICEMVASLSWQDLYDLVHSGSDEAKGILEHAVECDSCSDCIKFAEEKAWESLSDQDKIDLQITTEGFRRNSIKVLGF